MTDVSRREFAAIAVSAAAVPFGFGQTSTRPAAITARELIDRIKQHIGVEWKTETVDGLKAGDPSTMVRGVVTTSVATLLVLREAVKVGANVVITGHPTFYSRSDAHAPPLAADPVLVAKNKFVARHGLVVVRLSDHRRQRQPDPRVQGLAARFGWTRYQSATNPEQFEMPERTLETMVGAIRKSLSSGGGMRVVGDRRTTVRRVGLLPGSTPIQATVSLLPHVDVIVAGEVREWESVEYVRDAVSAGGNKALILLGRIVSEELGMQGCAAWLRTFVPDVPVRHIGAGDPYWRPAR